MKEDLLTEMQDNLYLITLNRTAIHNAFDNDLLNDLQTHLDEAISNPLIQVIVLKANGSYFSSGADLAWMQRVATYTEEENIQDAIVLARLMNTIYQCPKPTIAVVQGPAFGGGVGLIAAADIAIASTGATFCFSEVRLGLIPAVISPYIVKAIGERAATWLFMTAKVIEATEAQQLQLVHYCLKPQELWPFSLELAKHLAELPPHAVKGCKSLVRQVAGRSIDENLIQETALEIAKKRVSQEGQAGMTAFLAKRKTHV